MNDTFAYIGYIDMWLKYFFIINMKLYSQYMYTEIPPHKKSPIHQAESLEWTFQVK